MTAPPPAWRRLGAWLLLGPLLGLAACGWQEEVRVLRVGGHHISMHTLPGWVHLDHGKQHLFRRGFAMLEVRDLGERPASDEDAEMTEEEWIERDLAHLGMDTQRSIASRASYQRQGRQFYLIDTWDRLTHTMRKRYAFVANNGKQLAIYTRQGDWKLTQPSCDRLLDSLRFVDAAAGPPDEGADSADGDRGYPAQ